jgi:hypothetical protein
VIGDWMGSQYGVGGRRWDYRLFLDHDGHYERTVRSEPDYERRDAGSWFYDGASAQRKIECLTGLSRNSETRESWRARTVCRQPG